MYVVQYVLRTAYYATISSLDRTADPDSMAHSVYVFYDRSCFLKLSVRARQRPAAEISGPKIANGENSFQHRGDSEGCQSAESAGVSGVTLMSRVGERRRRRR